jgi:hypothetical protein
MFCRPAEEIAMMRVKPSHSELLLLLFLKSDEKIRK